MPANASPPNYRKVISVKIYNVFECMHWNLLVREKAKGVMYVSIMRKLPSPHCPLLSGGLFPYVLSDVSPYLRNVADTQQLVRDAAENKINQTAHANQIHMTR